MWCNICGVSYVVQSMWCNQCGVRKWRKGEDEEDGLPVDLPLITHVGLAVSRSPSAGWSDTDAMMAVHL